MISFKSRKARRVVVLIAVISAVVVGCGSSGGDGNQGTAGGGSGSGGSPITIGVSLPLTGPAALIGEPLRAGFQMAADDTNRAGGVGGRHVKLQIQDQGSDNTSALNAFNRLMSDNPAAIIGAPVSTQALAVAPQAEREGIPVLSGGTNPEIAAASPWMFDYYLTSTLGVQAGLQYVTEQLHAKRIAVLRSTDAYGVGAMAVMRNSLKGTPGGAALVTEQQYQVGAKDIAAQAQKVKQSNPDVVIVFGQQADYIVAGGALASAGVDAPVLMDGLQPASLKEMQINGLGDIYTRAECVPAESKEAKVRDWTHRYQSRFGDAPPEYAAVGYDGMQLLIAAIKKAGTDHAAIRDALSTAPKTTGICGVHMGGPDGTLSFSVTIAKATASKVFKPLTQLTLLPTERG